MPPAEADGAADRPSSVDALYEEVGSWFTPDALRRELSLGSSATEQISLSWLAKAGKRFRPFLVACLFRTFGADGGEPVGLTARRLALAVECIHKASLIYDDIQDDDRRRYGEPTLHHVHGVPVALTASLLLLGHGYRLIADCGAGAAKCAEMLTLAAQGHCDLCLGQGEELLWMRSPAPLSPEQVLEIFRWKTAPSFEVVFRLPAICAGADRQVHEVLERYSALVGTAYQVQDDLDDFHGRGDVDDVKAKRPSIVLAVAHERADPAARRVVASAWCGRGGSPDQLRRIIADVGAEEEAREILERHKRDALDALRPLENIDLKVLLCRVTDKILPGA